MAEKFKIKASGGSIGLVATQPKTIVEKPVKAD